MRDKDTSAFREMFQYPSWLWPSSRPNQMDLILMDYCTWQLLVSLFRWSTSRWITTTATAINWSTFITIRALPWPCYTTSPPPSSGSCWPSSSSRCSSWSPSSTSTGATAGKDAKLDQQVLDDLHCQRPGSTSTRTWLTRSCLTGLAGCCQTL